MRVLEERRSAFTISSHISEAQATTGIEEREEEADELEDTSKAHEADMHPEDDEGHVGLHITGM